MSWPPQDCLYERNCRQNGWPSAYLGCICWFWSHGGELSDDGIHVYLPPHVGDKYQWMPEWPDETLVAEAAAYPPDLDGEDLDQRGAGEAGPAAAQFQDVT